MEDLDDPHRLGEIKDRILHKAALRRFYQEVYDKYAECLNRCPKKGLALELGSGGGFVKDVIPEMTTSDVIPYEGVDEVVNAVQMSFDEDSLRGIFMLNVFHHIPDVDAFLCEARRTLRSGGRILIVDQYPGLFSRFIFRYAHHEPFDPDATEWAFASDGPLSSANGALAWIVFLRDQQEFERRHPELQMTRFEPHSPVRYWLAGGLKRWSLLPGRAFSLATRIDEALTRMSPQLGSFVDIELVRR
ncbi:class I SAM-dependent methyltransferase [Myxococcota bacterium]